jgi:predicted transcriptional regulator
MARRRADALSRRERQIMDVVYRRSKASVAEVLAGMADPPSYSAVRAMLRILEDKGHLTHRREGARYIYLPTRPRRRAGQSALRRVLRTFFDGSLERAVAAHLADASSDLSGKELERLAKLIRDARTRGG